MEPLKLLLNLTPLGFFVFLGGLAISAAAIVYLQKPTSKLTVTPEPPGPVVLTIVVIENWQRSAQSVEIVDPQGRRAAVEAIVLSNDFNWALESHSKVERNGEQSNVSMHLLTPGISKVISGYSEVFAIGAASSEGAAKNPAAEDDRASRRADQLQLWIKEYVPSTKALYSLSIGHFKPGLPNKSSFSEQRKIVIVGVVRSDPNFDLQTALHKNLGKVSAFPFDLQNYSKFELVRRR